MFNFSQLSSVHIEISNRCQASCPMCPRNIHGGIDNPLIKNADWTLEEFKQVFNLETLNQLTKINFCGTFGDPMMNNDFIGMCSYIKDTAPHIDLHIHTNGSARSAEWWKQLAQVMTSKHQVVFALDGLEDTQALYRVGTSWKKIIENEKAFMSAGGTAV